MLSGWKELPGGEAEEGGDGGDHFRVKKFTDATENVKTSKNEGYDLFQCEVLNVTEEVRGEREARKKPDELKTARVMDIDIHARYVFKCYVLLPNSFAISHVTNAPSIATRFARHVPRFAPHVPRFAPRSLTAGLRRRRGT